MTEAIIKFLDFSSSKVTNENKINSRLTSTLNKIIISPTIGIRVTIKKHVFRLQTEVHHLLKLFSYFELRCVGIDGNILH